VAPPSAPAQLHFQGPLSPPLTAEAVPAPHKPVLGMIVRLAPFALPQRPLISSWAAQACVAPPFDPAQVQAKGPEPVTVDADPALHKLVVGALVTLVPFALPQAPLVSS
jgi:hypothetical protein